MKLRKPKDLSEYLIIATIVIVLIVLVAFGFYVHGIVGFLTGCVILGVEL